MVLIFSLILLYCFPMGPVCFPLSVKGKICEWMEKAALGPVLAYFCRDAVACSAPQRPGGCSARGHPPLYPLPVFWGSAQMENVMNYYVKLHAQPLQTTWTSFSCTATLLWGMAPPRIDCSSGHVFSSSMSSSAALFYTHTYIHTYFSSSTSSNAAPSYTHTYFSSTSSKAVPSYTQTCTHTHAHTHTLLLYVFQCCNLLHTHTSPLCSPRLCPLTHTYIHTNTHTHKTYICTHNTYSHTTHIYIYTSPLHPPKTAPSYTHTHTHTHTHPDLSPVALWD